MAKIVKFDSDARSAMLKGVDILARISTPFSIADLASESNFTIFAIIKLSFY